jgi:uncharacterized protein (TIGR03067 family)
MFARRNQPTLPPLIAAATFVALCSLASWQNQSLGEPATNNDAVFRQLDSSGDGILTMDEATIATRSLFGRLFKEAGKGSGERLTRKEFDATYERLRSKSAPAPSKSPEKKSENDSPPAGIGFIDANGDDAISRTEWQKFTQAFSRLDADKDNALSATELQVTGGLAEVLMKLADANGDGEVARVEWAKLVHSFARLDANSDSSVDLAELEKFAGDQVTSASGSASLSGKGAGKSGPTRWRGRIEGRGEIELLVDGNTVTGREFGRGGGGEGLGSGTINMTGDGKSGNMDAVYTEGDRRGQVCLGIYKLDGDTLVWCVNNRGTRPDSLQSSRRGNWLLTLSRVTANP